ncbi:hypothetical protein K144313037_00240 [Clostridium tetani]|uniref:hypothetical protein n=1 Tax=Clostridium tetani TaxID=1513 RepID=UPI000D1FEB50|nr:hypothetical protein [Clostridium tetani]AVP55981.1 hypothetical protein C3B72_12910 [Clostridium tetani]RXI49640.1 hypothetical protein DP124_12695 [Clostridium tetani]RXM59282.1 hypothetical protein DP133_00410 [Clostridium tetani]RXM72986.1 hypothetical protein DP139_00180 [Clostridium tetani]BDR63090.1 hypothetical protein K134307016_00240 [Clostridium tetani]
MENLILKLISAINLILLGTFLTWEYNNLNLNIFILLIFILFGNCIKLTFINKNNFYLCQLLLITSLLLMHILYYLIPIFFSKSILEFEPYASIEGVTGLSFQMIGYILSIIFLCKINLTLHKNN